MSDMKSTPISGFSTLKLRLDLHCGEADWTLHDIRRTARSLMSRAGVNPVIAERCLGHAIGGKRRVYDRHPYIEEMRHAFEALATQIERIVHPVENVVARGLGTIAICAKRVMPKRVMSQKLPAAVSPLDAFGGRATREHRIRVRSQRSG